MVDKSRAKLRPRGNRNLDEVLNARAASITAKDIADPVVEPTDNAVPTPAPEVVVDQTPPNPEPTPTPNPEPIPTPDPVAAKDVDEDDWVSGLTPVSANPDLVNTDPEKKPEPTPTPEPIPDAVLDTSADERRLERMRSMTTIDEEVAQEIYNTVLKPELDEIRSAYDQQVSDISGTLTEQQKRQEEYDRNNKAQARAKTNDLILDKHPHAAKIMQSAEFNEFLKTKQDPYSQQSKYDILNTAYNAGDADYVIRELDAFAETRRKPKPQASVDVNSGGSPNTSSPGKKQPMSQKQYLAERKALMSRRHKPGDLTNLYNQYMASQQ